MIYNKTSDPFDLGMLQQKVKYVVTYSKHGALFYTECLLVPAFDRVPM